MAYINKYQPNSLKEIVGNEDSIKELVQFIKNYSKEKKKSALLYGPSGVGKTSSVYAISNDNNLEIIEVNASDFRNKDMIDSVIGNAINQGSLFGRQKIILIDEIDGISGTKDRGATQEIVKLMKNSKFPIILTAQNPFDAKFSTLRNNSKLIPFKELDHKSVFIILEKICKNEKINYEENSLKSLARMCGGDLRSAINDLEGISARDNSVTKEDILNLTQRDKEESMPSALVKVLKNSDANIALAAFDNIKEDIDQQFLWLDKNMPMEYLKAKDRNEAYNHISRADIFRRRIRRRQHWRFLVYIKALLTAGIATSKEKKYDHFVKYEQTGRLLKIFWANQKKAKKKTIATRIATKLHSSLNKEMQNSDYYKISFKKNKDFHDKFIEEFELDKDEIAYMKK